MIGDRHESVAFEPVRIGGRRRGVDPVLIGALAVVVGLLATIVKPWEERPQWAQVPSQRALASSAAPSSPPSSLPRPTAAPVLLDDPLATLTVLDALEPHDDWGIRTVERAPDWRTGYRERWLPAPLSATGNRQVTISPSDPALVLGITTPASQTPLGIRVFRTSGTGGWTWLDVARVASDRPDTALLLRPPRVAGRDRAAWIPGIYRVELLMGDHIETVDLALTDPDGRIPDPPRITRPSDGIVEG